MPKSFVLSGMNAMPKMSASIKMKQMIAIMNFAGVTIGGSPPPIGNVDSGRPELRLLTNERMTRNQVIYARAGFVETDRQEEDGFRRVFMRKPLP